MCILRDLSTFNAGDLKTVVILKPGTRNMFNKWLLNDLEGTKLLHNDQWRTISNILKDKSYIWNNMLNVLQLFAHVYTVLCLKQFIHFYICFIPDFSEYIQDNIDKIQRHLHEEICSGIGFWIQVLGTSLQTHPICQSPQ